jgi:hypothetical protein
MFQQQFVIFEGYLSLARKSLKIIQNLIKTNLKYTVPKI